MDIAKLQAAGIDYEDGLRRCAGNDSLYERLLGMFAQDTNYAESLEAFEKRTGTAFSRTCTRSRA